jgi:hypothetical protein
MSQFNLLWSHVIEVAAFRKAGILIDNMSMLGATMYGEQMSQCAVNIVLLSLVCSTSLNWHKNVLKYIKCLQR